MADQFTTEVWIRPGYDHRDDPKGNGGAHNVEFQFNLRGPDGAISWRLGTGWVERPLDGPFIPGGPQKRRDKPGADARLWDYSPSAGAVSSHTHTQTEEWQIGPSECDVLGGQCYGDTGYLIGDSVLDAMFRNGHEGVWAKLREIYDEWIGKKVTS